MTTRIPVSADTPYEVVIGHGVLGELARLVPEDVERIAFVHAPVMAETAAQLAGSLPGHEVLLVEVPEGEAAKDVVTLQHCWERLGVAGFTRSDMLVGIGGGATTDLAGFVAATWLRGIRFVTAPTTVLGMVDAAVGGKTGINTAHGKNLVGAFHEPVGVLCDLDLLMSLPAAEARSGLAEVAKCGFIADPSILESLETKAVLDADSPVLATLIAKGVAVKARVVSGDLREAGGSGGGREALNYGHTLGHAIERLEGYRIRHGEAISIGMVFAAELARLDGRIDAELVDRHRALFGRLGLPTSYRADAWDDLLAVVRLDKKARGKTLRFVVLDGLGQTSVLSGPDEGLLRAAYDAISG
jgi:3-dehydroquinate synthase